MLLTSPVAPQSLFLWRTLQEYASNPLPRYLLNLGSFCYAGHLPKSPAKRPEASVRLSWSCFVPQIDTVPPAVVSVSSRKPAGAYTVGDSIDIIVSLSKGSSQQNLFSYLTLVLSCKF